jgi:hypothetical protein
MIGLGGTGLTILQMIRRKFFDRFGDLDEFPIVRYLFVDTDQAFQTQLTKEATKGIPARIEPTEAEKVVALVKAPSKYTRNRKMWPHIDRWLSPHLNDMFPILDGAGQIRQKSRLAFFENYDAIKAALQTASSQSRDVGERTRLSKKLGLNISNEPRFHLFCSLAGGTGSGMFLDVAFLLRHLFGEGAFIQGTLVLGEVYGNEPILLANTYMALRELEHFTFEAPFDYEWKRGEPSDRTQIRRPFSNVHLLGSENMRGKSYGARTATDPRHNLFSMVAEAVFLEFGTADFGNQERSVRINLVSDNDTRYVLTNPVEKLRILSDSRRDEYPLNYSSFGLSILRVPLDRIKRACSYWLAAEILDVWRGVGSQDANLVKARELAIDVLRKLKVLEEKGKTGAHQLLDTLYDAGSGSSFLAQVDRWVNGELRRALEGARPSLLEGEINRQLGAFEGPLLGDNGKCLVQMNESERRLKEEFDSNLYARLDEAVEEKGTLSAAALQENLRGLLDDPQMNYGVLTEELTTFQIASRTAGEDFRVKLRKVASIARWINPLKLPFKSLALERAVEEFLEAVKQHFECRVKAEARQRAIRVVDHMRGALRNSRDRDQARALESIRDYCLSMRDSYRGVEPTVQIKDLYRPEDLEVLYYPRVVGGSEAEHRRTLSELSGSVLNELHQLYPTHMRRPSVAELRNIPVRSDRELGDAITRCLLAEVDRKLAGVVSVARRLEDEPLAEYVDLSAPWLTEESKPKSTFEYDKATRMSFLCGFDGDLPGASDVKGKLRRTVQAVFPSVDFDKSLRRLDDPSQLILYNEMAKFPLFHCGFVNRYRDAFVDFTRREPAHPLGLDSSMRAVREICLPDQEARELEKQVRKLLLLGVMLDEGMRSVSRRGREGDQEVEWQLHYSEEVDQKEAGVPRDFVLGDSWEAGIPLLMSQEGIRRNLKSLVFQKLDRILQQGDRWKELRALMLYYLSRLFPRRAASAEGSDPRSPRVDTCASMEHVILDELLEARLHGPFERGSAEDKEAAKALVRAVNDDLARFTAPPGQSHAASGRPFKLVVERYDRTSGVGQPVEWPVWLD